MVYCEASLLLCSPGRFADFKYLKMVYSKVYAYDFVQVFKYDYSTSPARCKGLEFVISYPTNGISAPEKKNKSPK